MYEISWGAISGEKLKCNRLTILAAIGAVVKHNIVRKAPYGIDRNHSFEVVLQFQKAPKCQMVAAPLWLRGRAAHS